MMFITMRHDTFDFCHRNHRQESTEQQEQGREQTETSNQHHDVDAGRMKISPAGRDEVTTQGRDRNHETFEPHTDVYEDADDHHDPRSRSAFLDPEQLRDHYVAGHHDPVSPPEVTKRSVDERKLLIRNARVPSDKELDAVRRANHHACRHDDFVHVF